MNTQHQQSIEAGQVCNSAIPMKNELNEYYYTSYLIRRFQNTRFEYRHGVIPDPAHHAVPIDTLMMTQSDCGQMWWIAGHPLERRQRRVAPAHNRLPHHLDAVI